MTAVCNLDPIMNKVDSMDLEEERELMSAVLPWKRFDATNKMCIHHINHSKMT